MNDQTKTLDHSATYSPQDDKLRLFLAYRVSKEEWAEIKRMGFTWTMKQDSDAVAKWTPEREDFLLTMCEDIGDEDQPREERSADRAERFDGYQEKREGEAHALADAYEAGPAVHGNQSLARAERARARHDRLGEKATTQWGKAEYWTSRTAGVIRHALHLERADVRFRRIKGYESDARRLANRTDARGMRWAAHYDCLLAYERQMLAAQGGAGVVEVEMVVGGFIDDRQIVKISKDRAGRVSKVYFSVPAGADYWTRYAACVKAEKINGDYRAPTPEELDLFNGVKKAKKAAAPKDPVLINPTPESAQALQDYWNACYLAELVKAGNKYRIDEFKPETICKMSQKEYSNASAGNHSFYQTRYLRVNWSIKSTSNMWTSEEAKANEVPAACRIRLVGGGYSSPRRVVVIVDKPGKELPARVEWAPVAAAAVVPEIVTITDGAEAEQQVLFTVTE
jgi:hypothetical protein